MNAENTESELQRLVSKTYRELSTESAPEHLNQAVLKQAAVEVTRKRSYMFAGWRKQVAWTAVIALSLAVVLELAELQTLSIPDAVTPASPAASKSELRTEEPSAGRELPGIQPAQQPDARERSESIAKPMARKARVAAPVGCDEATRASQEDWMDCIRKLRESGAVELADMEYEAFLLDHPRE